MEFGIEKCAMLVKKSGKRHLTDGMELPNQDKIRTLGEREIYKYLGILERDTIKQVEMKEKIKKEFLKRTRELLKKHYVAETLSREKNCWTVSLVRYSGPFLKWTWEQMDQRTRKLVTTLTDNKYLEKREEEDMSASKTALTHRYNDSRFT